MKVLISNNRLSIVYLEENMSYDVWQNSLDEDNRRFVPDEVFETLKETQEVVKQLIDCYSNEEGPYIYAVIRNEDKTNLGYVQLVWINEGYEIGYHIAKKYTGHVYATEAVNLYLEYLKDNSDLKEVYGVALATNKASRRVLEKTGFMLYFEGYDSYQGKKRKIIKTVKAVK